MTIFFVWGIKSTPNCRTLVDLRVPSMHPGGGEGGVVSWSHGALDRKPLDLRSSDCWAPEKAAWSGRG